MNTTVITRSAFYASCLAFCIACWWGIFALVGAALQGCH